MPRVLEADVLVCHQGHPRREPWFPENVPAVAVFHSEPSQVYRAAQKLMPCATIGQHMAEAYAGLPMVPNLIPLKHHWYQPQPKPTDCVRICYSPSNRQRRGWAAKGYEVTVPVLERLDEREDVDICIIEKQPLWDSLEAKATAHIVIDEVVTGGYHRSSLEGAALGCVVVNSCTPKNRERIKEMSGASDAPFVTVQAAGLADQLEQLIALGPEKLTAIGNVNRWWMEEYWNSANLIDRCWMPFLEEALV